MSDFKKVECVFAWTATEGYEYYPPFINISVVDGKHIRLAVRGSERDGKCGEYVDIILPRDQMMEMISASHLALQLTKD